MIARVVDLMQPGANDTILDLFCGIGNLTLPIARHAGSVVGVEGAETSVERALYNAKFNHITNTSFYRADLIRDLDKHEWAHQKYSKLLLDPSRAGALEVLPWIPRWDPKRIVYVSCKPINTGARCRNTGQRLQLQTGLNRSDGYVSTDHSC